MATTLFSLSALKALSREGTATVFPAYFRTNCSAGDPSITAIRFPGISSAVLIADELSLLTVMVLDIPAISEVAVSKAMTIQIPEIILPAIVFGALSP